MVANYSYVCLLVFALISVIAKAESPTAYNFVVTKSCRIFMEKGTSDDYFKKESLNQYLNGGVNDGNACNKIRVRSIKMDDGTYLVAIRYKNDNKKFEIALLEPRMDAEGKWSTTIDNFQEIDFSAHKDKDLRLEKNQFDIIIKDGKLYMMASGSIVKWEKNPKEQKELYCISSNPDNPVNGAASFFVDISNKLKIAKLVDVNNLKIDQLDSQVTEQPSSSTSAIPSVTTEATGQPLSTTLMVPSGTPDDFYYLYSGYYVVVFGGNKIVMKESIGNKLEPVLQGVPDFSYMGVFNDDFTHRSRNNGFSISYEGNCFNFVPRPTSTTTTTVLTTTTTTVPSETTPLTSPSEHTTPNNSTKSPPHENEITLYLLYGVFSLEMCIIIFTTMTMAYCVFILHRE